MKWWIRIGVGVVDMDEFRMVDMDRELGWEIWYIFGKGALVTKGGKGLEMVGITLSQLWLQ